MPEADERPAKNRVVKSLGWLDGWAFFALGTGVVAGVISELLMSRRAGRTVFPMRAAARGSVAVAAVALSVPVIGTGLLWWELVKHARREYEAPVARRISLVLTASAGLAVSLYSAAALWFLRWLWRRLEPWSLTFGSMQFEPRESPSWKVTLLLIAVSLFLARSTILGVYATQRNYRVCLRVLGVRRVLRGIALMARLRLRQPRRDFFAQTPIVSDMQMFLFAVIAYAVIPSDTFAVAIASMITLLDLSVTFDRIRPPTWFFLGASSYDSFVAFLELRRTWGVTAVTLIDRTNDAGRLFYDFERTWRSQDPWSPGGAPKMLFYDPGVPRIWNLRTRPNLWDFTVVQLIDYVPRVVVDLRHPSGYVRAEVDYLIESNQTGKAWFVVGDEGLPPILAAIIPPEAHARALTEEALIRIAEPESDRAPRRAPQDKSPTPNPP